MKKFNRVLAMLLALVMVLAILPISAIADTWLNVEAEKETNGNETTTDVTVTVDPKALLSYLQDGDLKGLLKGISATGGLGSIMTKEELLAIIPEEQLIDLAKAIVADIDAKALIECLDADALLACVDKAGLVNLLKGIDLQKYVKDVDLLMGYINDEDLEKAVAHINTTELIKDYASELMNLALGLTPEKLFEIVKIDAAVKLDGVDVKAAANLGYIQGTIGYATLASTYVNKTALDVYVDANVNRFSATIPAYVNKNKLSSLFGGVKDKLANYMDSAATEAIVRKAIADGVLTIDAVLPYVNGDTIDVDAMVANNVLVNLYDELLIGDGTNPAAVDVKVLLFGNGTLAPLFPDLAALITANVLNVEDLLNNEVIKIDELITAKVIDVDALAAGYGYNNLVKFNVIKDQITTALANNNLTAANLVACLKDYTAAVRAIGVSAAINAIPGGFATVIDYVTNFNAILDIVGVETIAIQMVKDRTITDIVDVVGVVKAIGPAAVVSKVDVMQLIKVIYESGVVQDLIGMLDFDKYLVKAFNILATLQKTITEIEIDGVVITERNEESGYIKFLPAKLIDAIENLVPTLDELASIDNSGKLFEAGFAFSYLDEEGVEHTKRYNFSFVLTAGIDTIRAAAAKLSALVDKIGSVEFVNGELVADITVPSEFASVIRIVLEKMADSNDPEFNALKDKILAICQATPDDFIAFAEGLTLEEVVAVLDAIDPALFGKVYNKVLASRYAEVLLAYIEKVTGIDLSNDVKAQNLINTIAEIPTFEVFVEKLESVTGIEITDHLPAKVNGYLDNTVFDVIDKLADRFGYDFDLYQLLKNAAASSDPFAYLYTAVVNKVENSGAIYNYVKTNAIKVANRLMATDYGKKLADNCLLDFYRLNSTFVFDDNITFDAKVVLEKGLRKVLGLLGNYAPSVATKLDGYVADILDILLADNSTATTGIDITIHVNNLYRVDFVNEYGTTFLSTLLPVGTDISKMVDYSGIKGFNGWVDSKTGEYVDVMPARDVILKADVQGATQHTVTIIPVDEDGNRLSGGNYPTISVTDGTRLREYVGDLNRIAEGLYSLLPELSAEQILLGHGYDHKFDGNLEAVVEGNIEIEVVIFLSKTKNEASVKINGGDFEISLDNGDLTITLGDDWNNVIANNNLTALNFTFNKDLIATLNSVVLTANVANAQKVTLNQAMLAQLLGIANGSGAKTVGLSYANATTSSEKELGKAFYHFNFAFDGVVYPNITFANGATVAIVLPYAGILEENDDAKTVVTLDGEEMTAAGNGLVVTENTVSFNAPHFSEVYIVNKYRVTVKDTEYAVDGIAADRLPAITGGPLVVFKNNAGESINDFYAPGDQIKGTYEVSNLPAGLVYDKLLFNGIEFTGTFTMKAEPVTVTSVLKTITYNIYYFVGRENYKTISYTIFNAPEVDGLLARPNGDYNDSYEWYGTVPTAETLFDGDFYLFWLNPTETVISVKFYNGNDLVASLDYTVSEWRNSIFDAIKQGIADNNGKYLGYVWVGEGDKQLTAYTDDTLIDAALRNNNTLVFQAVEEQQRPHNVFVDGDVTVNKNSAVAGDIITVTGNRVGYTTLFEVYTTIDGEPAERILVFADGTFEMPDSNVIIIVTGYTANSVSYTDKDGNTVTGTYGDANKIVITVPAGSTLHTNMMPEGSIGNLSAAPAGLVLVSAVRTEDGSLVLTYQYTLTEAVDEQAFIAQVQSFIQISEYGVVTYVVNGVEYATMADAMANLPKRATVVEWAQVSPNVMIAILEYQTLSVWAIISIILGVLLLLAIIVLIYVLHVTDRIGTNWLTKVCVAIVGVFFAFCMLIAKVALKILNFMGIKDEDILEALPVEPVDDIPVVLIDPNALSTEEGEDVEEVLGEESATEEALAEEVTEEASAEEETTEEAPVEDATTEEAPVEEVTTEEAPVEDAIPVEVIDETATEEAPAEEAVVEETPAEEAPAEEATEEAPAEEVTEETPAEEATTEEAPAEEATEETAQEAVEEEKKDE